MLHDVHSGRWAYFAVTAWSVAIVAVCLHALLRPERNSVYPIFAEAGRDWMAGGELYEADMKPFRYSPAVAAFFAPLGLLPNGLGGAAWRLLSAAVLLAGLWAWVGSLLPRSLTGTHRAVLFLLVLPLAASNLHNGQSNALVLGLLLLGTAAAAREHWNLAAVAVAVAVLFKLYPIALGLLLVTTYPRRFGPRLAVALLAGLALPLVFQRPAYAATQYIEWVRHLAADHRHDLTPDLWYRDFRSLLLFAGVPVDETVWRTLQLLTAALCAAACLASPNRPRLALDLACFWMTLFGPATEPTTYLLLAPTAAWAAVDAWTAWRRVEIKVLLLAGHVLITASLVAVWFPFGRQTLPQELRPLGALLLLAAVLAVELPRLRRVLRGVEDCTKLSASQWKEHRPGRPRVSRRPPEPVRPRETR